MKWKKIPTHRFLQDSNRIIIYVKKKKHCSFCRTDPKKCQPPSLTHLTPFLEWTKRSLITVSQHPQKTVLHCTAWGRHVLLQMENFLQGQWRLMRRGGGGLNVGLHQAVDGSYDLCTSHFAWFEAWGADQEQLSKQSNPDHTCGNGDKLEETTSIISSDDCLLRLCSPGLEEEKKVSAIQYSWVKALFNKDGFVVLILLTLFYPQYSLFWFYLYFQRHKADRTDSKTYLLCGLSNELHLYSISERYSKQIWEEPVISLITLLVGGNIGLHLKRTHSNNLNSISPPKNIISNVVPSCDELLFYVLAPSNAWWECPPPSSS